MLQKILTCDKAWTATGKDRNFNHLAFIDCSQDPQAEIGCGVDEKGNFSNLP